MNSLQDSSLQMASCQEVKSEEAEKCHLHDHLMVLSNETKECNSSKTVQYGGKAIPILLIVRQLECVEKKNWKEKKDRMLLHFYVEERLALSGL